MVQLEEGSSKEICAEIFEIWEQSRSNWHWPLLPSPGLGSSSDGQFPFENYSITLDHDILRQGHIYIENLFDHLIVHYIFCPRSLEIAANLALSAVRGLENPSLAKRMLNIFSDIIVESFRFERSSEDQDKVLVGWRGLCKQAKTLSEMDRVIIGFLADYWSVTSIPGKVIQDLALSRKGCMILCITDTHIQNLYLEWDHLKGASETSSFVLFCIDQAGRDKHVEEALRGFGKVYYVNHLQDLIRLVVEATELNYSSNSGNVLSLAVSQTPGAPR